MRQVGFSAKAAVIFCLFLCVIGSRVAFAQTDQTKRYALVVGNGNYQFQALPSSGAQDATLVANALASQGFEVFGGRDLSQPQLVAALREFKNRVEPTRENNLIVVYLAGRFVQVANQNFYLPVDYRPVEPIELGKVGVRISDLQGYLGSLAGKGHLALLDSGNSVPVPLMGFRPIQGMATVKPIRNSAIGLNTTPGLLGADYLDPIGPFARALAEGIERGAPSWQELFSFIRVRQLQLTNGDSIAAFQIANERMPLAFQPGANPIVDVRAVQQLAMKDMPNASLAFTFALGRGTPEALDEFNFLHPAHPLVPRSKIILSAMREARVWTQVLGEDKPEAYWAYLKLYPRGGHSAEAVYRLKMLNSPVDPPKDAPLLVISNPPSSVDETSAVIRFSPIALDDERLRLQSVVLPYSRLIGDLDKKFIPKPVNMTRGGLDLPVIPGFEKAPGRIVSLPFQAQ